MFSQILYFFYRTASAKLIRMCTVTDPTSLGLNEQSVKQRGVSKAFQSCHQILCELTRNINCATISNVSMSACACTHFSAISVA